VWQRVKQVTVRTEAFSNLFLASVYFSIRAFCDFFFSEMSLFEVPGWSIPSTPVKEQSNKSTKKRKHPNTQSQGHAEKLLMKFSNDPPKVGDVSKKRKGEPSSADQEDETSLSAAANASRNRKRRRQNQTLNQELRKRNVSDVSPAPLTALQRNMKESLEGARFRCVSRSASVRVPNL
jgi:ribosomal RNA-processing protein 8